MIKNSVNIGEKISVSVRAILAIVVCSFCVTGNLYAQNKNYKDRSDKIGKKARNNSERENGPRKERPFPPPEQAWDVATIILGSPAADRITMSIYPSRELECFIEYGAGSNLFGTRTESHMFKAKMPTQLTLTGLTVNTEYTYRLRYRNPGETEFKIGPEYHFHTQRLSGSTFTFEIQGDSHPERTPRENDPALYAQTLIAVAQDRPDFYFCMGDDFSVDSLPEVTAESVERVYLKQLPYLGLVAHSSPLFLVNGNHEQAARYNLNGTANNAAVWAQTNRNRLFPQPVPDGFYSGNREKVEYIGLLRDYYAWTWGDALFVVIDPYWHSSVPVDNVIGSLSKQRDMWDITLGDAQYKWLKETLEGSPARFKFVFAHHVLGTDRGGIEMSDLYEWGGRNKRGDWEFDQKRPGWDMPVHQLMTKNKVTIFFQGHDHIFAKQEKDGVIYQTLPHPANPNYAFANWASAYRTGDILPDSGRVRVVISPEEVKVEYIRSFLPQDESAENKNGMIAYSYRISGK